MTTTYHHLFACRRPGCRERWEVSYTSREAQEGFWEVAGELARVRTELDLHEANCREEKYAELE